MLSEVLYDYSYRNSRSLWDTYRLLSHDLYHNTLIWLSIGTKESFLSLSILLFWSFMYSMNRIYRNFSIIQLILDYAIARLSYSTAPMAFFAQQNLLPDQWSDNLTAKILCETVSMFIWSRLVLREASHFYIKMTYWEQDEQF